MCVNEYQYYSKGELTCTHWQQQSNNLNNYYYNTTTDSIIIMHINIIDYDKAKEKWSISRDS